MHSDFSYRKLNYHVLLKWTLFIIQILKRFYSNTKLSVNIWSFALVRNKSVRVNIVLKTAP